jgi:hypothetical protein
VIEGPVFEHPSADSLATIFESAAEFGLTQREIWETFVTTADGLPEDVKSLYVDELSGSLARRLVEKERLAAHRGIDAPPQTV